MAHSRSGWLLRALVLVAAVASLAAVESWRASASAQNTSQGSAMGACIRAGYEWSNLRSGSDVAAMRRFLQALPSHCVRVRNDVLVRLRELGVTDVVASVDARRAPSSQRAPVLSGGAQGLSDFAMFRDCDLCPDMIILPGGTFQMGPLPNDPEHRWHGPQRTISIGRFAVGRFEVTNEEWRPCISVSGCPPAYPPGMTIGPRGARLPMEQVYGAPRQPVVDVSWDEAQVYAAWLSRRTGKVYRLLSEAEWEYAARAGTTEPFYTGESVTSAQANIEYGGVTSPVGAYPGNPFGLFDTIGNAYEWTQDCYSEGYAGARTDGSAFERPNCEYRVFRGQKSNILSMDRHYVRGHFPSETEILDFGFRIARALE